MEAQHDSTGQTERAGEVARAHKAMMAAPGMISDEAVEAAAEAIFESRGRNKWDDASEFWSAAKESTRKEARQALEAAAPYMQATVTTTEDLDALPEGAMVRTDTGFYLKEALRRGLSTWVTTNEQYYFKTEDIELPATVIYTRTQR